MNPVLCTMVYCLRSDEVLLMLRHKEPNLGLWIAPGGKIEPGESPYESAVRELHEETGLQVRQLHFRGLITEVSPRPDWQWILFLFVATDFSGELVGDEREGTLRWWPLAEACQLPMPEADVIFFPRVTDLSQPFYHARCVYDEEVRLVEVVEHPAFSLLDGVLPRCHATR